MGGSFSSSLLLLTDHHSPSYIAIIYYNNTQNHLTLPQMGEDLPLSERATKNGLVTWPTVSKWPLLTTVAGSSIFSLTRKNCEKFSGERIYVGSGDRAQRVECLPRMHKALGLVPRIIQAAWCAGLYPSRGEAEGQRSSMSSPVNSAFETRLG